MLSPTSVFITGANRGIGLEFVKHFLKLPSPPKFLFATCRDPTAANDLQNLASTNSSLKILKLDLNNLDTLENIKDEVEGTLQGEGLNLIVNNAGAIARQNVEEVTEDVMMQLYKVNTVAPLMIAKTFLPALKIAAFKNHYLDFSCNRAAIINITSKVGSCADNASGGRYPYRCSKAALNMATKSLSVDLRGEGIMAVVLHPGWVKTEMGGPNALIDTTTSVEGMMQVMTGLNEDSNGLMFDYAGKLIPW